MVASLALPPSGIVPAIFFFSPVFYLSVNALTARQAALFAGLSSCGWFMASLYWIGSSLFVDGGLQLLLLPFVCLLFPLFLALFWAAAAAIAFRVFSSPSVRLIGLIICLGGADYLRSVVLTGFPWNVTAHAFLGSLILAQGASFVGQNGLNFLALSLIVAPVLLVQRRISLSVVCLTPFVLCLILSTDRVRTLPPMSKMNAQAPIIRLVQPNIPQQDKWDFDKRSGHLQQIVTLAQEKPFSAHLTVLPEAALASIWPSEQELVKNMAGLIASPSGLMATGILRRDVAGNLFNSVLFFDRAGQLKQIYDKQHLVPFGEYAPGRGLPFVDVIAGSVDVNEGQAAQPVILPDIGNLRVLICYEVIFPDFIAADNFRPDLLLTLSNDAWFGQTAGPHQHFAQARMRAIEEGLPVFRVANTGISGVIDSYGRVLARSDLGEVAVIDSPVPLALEETVYTQLRITAPLLLLLGYLFMSLWLEFFQQRLTKSK
jgi:apolipoprotein N-acyltransferase